MGLLLSSLGTFAQSTTIEATPIDNLSTYTGTEPYVFDMSARKYYALNNLNQYEEMGIYPEVSTLKVAGGGASTQIEYIATEEVNGGTNVPYINTNYIPKANTRIVMDVDIANSTAKGWMAVFGAREGGWYSHAFVLFARAWDAQTGCFNRTGDEHRGDSDIPRGQRMTIDAFERTCTFTLAGQSTPALTITTNEPGSTVEDCTNNLYLFDTNTAGAGGNQRDNSYVYMKLYGCQIYEGETLVKNFVPIVNAEGIGGLKETLSGQEFFSASSNNFVLSPDGQAIADDAGISVYPGKLVINTSDNHEYKWDGTQWVDLGSVYQPISDTNYQDMNNWICRFGYGSTYDNIENTNGNDNFFNPYKGESGWEPYQVRIDNLTKGETYRFSFKFTSQGWTSWDNGRWAALPVFVTNNWDFPQNDFYPTSVGGEVLGFTTLPKAAVTNQPYSFNFIADDDNVLAVNFGVVDDTPNYLFHFDDLLIELADYPEKYDLTWADPNKYTPLEYIESTGAARENAYTTPYIAKASTEIDLMFQSYSGGDWRAIFSGRNNSSTGISLYQNGNQRDFGYFVGGYINDNFTPYPGHNQDITVTASLAGLTVNGGSLVPTNRTTFNASTRKISLFANPEGDQAFRGRIYYFNISENGEAVYNFNPVMRHDGVFGYYDAATATFVIPAQGHLTGYGYKKIDGLAYMTYSPETRLVIAGNSAKYLPDVQNLDGATFTWSTADPSIATVAPDGTVTGVSGGKVMITVSTDADEGWTASYELTVSEPNYVRRDVNNVGYAVVTGGSGWGDSPVENIVDNNAGTKFGCSGTDDAWAIIIASEPVAVSQYSFVTGADTYNYPERNPRSWKLEGSMDNQNWTTIDEHDDFDAYMIHSVNKEEFVFPVNGTDTYKFFKISATAGAGFQLGEFWINEQAHTWGEPTETAATCTAEGKKTWECSDCHALKTEVLPIIAHNYVSGACTVCGATINEVVLLRDGQTDPYAIKFRHMAGSDNNIDIEAGWNTADFDDSAWDELMMPIGSVGYNDGARRGAQYNTVWYNEYNTYWFRRTFEVEDPSQVAALVLKILHDDNMWAYVNGTMVRECPGGNDWTDGTGWREIVIDPSLLVQGENVIAICIEQNWGGAYCDFSLIGSLQLALDDEEEGNIDKISAFEGATMPVALRRPLVSGTYNTIILPFDLSADEIAEAFGEGTTIASLASYDAENNNYSFQTATDIQAGVAYLIKPTADAPYVYNFTGRTIDAAIDDASLFVGSYDPQDVAVGDKLVAAGNKILAVTKAGQIKGFRAFFPASTGSGAKDATFSVDGESTGIIGIDGEIIETTGNIYDLQGRKVNKPQHGVYIVNGKKVVVK